MRFFKLLFLILFVSGCSFSPLYLSDEQLMEQTAQIQIESIDGVVGYTIRDQLNSKLKTQENCPKSYRLKITLSERVVGDLGIQQTNFATRSRLILTANYTLTDTKTNAVLLRDKTSASGSYNLTTAYSTMMAKDKMKQNLGKIVADNIAIRLLMYFKKQEVSIESEALSN